MSDDTGLAEGQIVERGDDPWLYSGGRWVRGRRVCWPGNEPGAVPGWTVVPDREGEA